MKTPGEDHRMIDGLAARLTESGVSARVRQAGVSTALADDATLDLDIDGVTRQLHVETRSRWTSDLDSWLEHLVDDGSVASRILVLPRLDSTRRAWLRERGINHADMTGALYLRLPGVRIHIDGGSKRHWGTLASARQQVNPFSKKASLVLRRFFEAPQATHSVSALARETGIAIGWAWNVTEELFQRGYIAGSGDALRLVDPAAALIHWSASYSWRKSARRNFVLPFTKSELEHQFAERWVTSSTPWALTLLSGAQRRVGHVIADNVTHVYALPSRAVDLERALSALHAREVAEVLPASHVLCLLRPYYGPAALFGEQMIDGLPVVSDLQLLLDLVHYPVRGVETAVHLLRTRLGPSVGMTTADIARVERSIS